MTAEGFAVGVTTEIVIGGDRARALYIVAANTPEEAIQAVRRIVSSGCTIDAFATQVSSETIRKLGLRPGQVRHL
jgi:hypothetical protein